MKHLSVRWALVKAIAYVLLGQGFAFFISYYSLSDILDSNDLELNPFYFITAIVVADIIGEMVLLFEHDLPLIKQEPSARPAFVFFAAFLQMGVGLSWISVSIASVFFAETQHIASVFFVIIVGGRNLWQAYDVVGTRNQLPVVLSDNVYFRKLCEDFNEILVFDTIQKSVSAKRNPCLRFLLTNLRFNIAFTLIVVLVGESLASLEVINSFAGCTLLDQVLARSVTAECVGGYRQPIAIVIVVVTVVLDIGSQLLLLQTHDLPILRKATRGDSYAADAIAKTSLLTRRMALVGGVTQAITAVIWFSVCVAGFPLRAAIFMNATDAEGFRGLFFLLLLSRLSIENAINVFCKCVLVHVGAIIFLCQTEEECCQVGVFAWWCSSSVDFVCAVILPSQLLAAQLVARGDDNGLRAMIVKAVALCV
jgi:hypothetical protein